MEVVTDDPRWFVQRDPDLERKLKKLRRRHDAGEVRVAWHRAAEPDCIHSGFGTDGRREERHIQPASACRICVDSPELAEWRRYWNELLRDIP